MSETQTACTEQLFDVEMFKPELVCFSGFIDMLLWISFIYFRERIEARTWKGSNCYWIKKPR